MRVVRQRQQTSLRPQPPSARPRQAAACTARRRGGALGQKLLVLAALVVVGVAHRGRLILQRDGSGWCAAAAVAGGTACARWPGGAPPSAPGHAEPVLRCCRAAAGGAAPLGLTSLSVATRTLLTANMIGTCTGMATCGAVGRVALWAWGVCRLGRRACCKCVAESAESADVMAER